MMRKLWKYIVLLCESAQQFRALMMILQYHKTLSMISMMLSQCPILCASEISQVLSPVLFRQSLYFPFQFTEYFIYFSLVIKEMCTTTYKFTFYGFRDVCFIYITNLMVNQPLLIGKYYYMRTVCILAIMLPYFT